METGDPRAILVDLAASRGTSLSALSTLIGRNHSYLQQFVRKGSPRKLEEGDRRQLARFFGVSESALGGAEENSFTPGGKRLRPDWLDIPRLALDASAGGGALGEMAGAEHTFAALRFSADWLRAQGLEAAQLSAIAVAGDSMEPTLRDGDEILVDRRPGPLRAGVHVVRVGDALLVKRLDPGRPGRLTLISDNPAYAPLDLAGDEVAVVGRVVWKAGRL